MGAGRGDSGAARPPCLPRLDRRGSTGAARPARPGLRPRSALPPARMARPAWPRRRPCPVPRTVRPRLPQPPAARTTSLADRGTSVSYLLTKVPRCGHGPTKVPQLRAGVVQRAAAAVGAQGGQGGGCPQDEGRGGPEVAVAGQGGRMAPDRDRLDRLAERRAFVLTRAEVLEEGGTPDWISHQVSSRRWQRMYPGVYVTHTGTLSWRTRMVAALRYCGQGAAISHRSADAYWFQRTEAQRLTVRGPVEVSVPWTRIVRPQLGLRVYRRRTMPDLRLGLLTVTGEADTALDLIDRLISEDDVVGVVTRVCRQVDPAELRRVAGRRSRLRHRSLVMDLVADVEDGIESPLEHRYHRDVERAHGLPRAQLQLRERLSGRWTRADCRYRRYLLRVELDGQLAHPGGRTDRDTWRDNAALLATDETTLRYRWRHVAVEACSTATQVVAALRRGGWLGVPRPCSPTCPVR